MHTYSIPSLTKLLFPLLLGALWGCTIRTIDSLPATQGLLKTTALHGRSIGVAIAAGPLASNDSYQELILREFNSVTPENEMKFAVLQPNPGEFDFRDADAIVDFAANNGLAIRGHPLVWHRRVPKWLRESSFSNKEATTVLEAFIRTVAGRYRETVQTWDVVNEAINRDGSLRNSYWQRTIGKQYIAYAFRVAHETNPTAALFYNDYDVVAREAKFDGIYELLRDLKLQNVPIHGVGLQMHIRPNALPSEERLQYVLERFAALDLDIHITELDVALTMPITAEKLHWQAQQYEMVARQCLLQPRCTSLTVWGVSDAHSWIPKHFKSLDAATMFDTNYKKKPAYWALHSALSTGAQ